MKTVGMIIVCGLTMLKPPSVSAMSCPSSGGYTTTQNGKTYCQSTGAYKNYWSNYSKSQEKNAKKIIFFALKIA